MKNFFFPLIIPLLLVLSLTQCTEQESVNISKENQEKLNVSDEDLMAFHENFGELVVQITEDLPENYIPVNEEELAQKIDSEMINQFMIRHKAEINTLSKNMVLSKESYELVVLVQNTKLFSEKTSNFQSRCKFRNHAIDTCLSDCFNEPFTTAYGTLLIESAACSTVPPPANAACATVALAKFLWIIHRLDRRCQNKCCPKIAPPTDQ